MVVYGRAILLGLVFGAIAWTQGDVPQKKGEPLRRLPSPHMRRRLRPNMPPPPYAVQMEPVIKYSQMDPLYHQKIKNNTNEILSRGDYEPEASNNVAELVTGYEGDSYVGGYPHSYYQEPEPIIEIIIKESNESLPAPPPQPTLPPPPSTKEPVHVFYVKYKKNPHASGKPGESDVIYEPPVPALTEHTTETIEIDPHASVTEAAPVYTAPPSQPPSTTFRAIIRPESETYYGSNLKVTFGKPEKSNPHHDHELHVSASEPEGALPVDRAQNRDSSESVKAPTFKRQQISFDNPPPPRQPSRSPPPPALTHYQKPPGRHQVGQPTQAIIQRGPPNANFGPPPPPPPPRQQHTTAIFHRPQQFTQAASPSQTHSAAFPTADRQRFQYNERNKNRQPQLPIQNSNNNGFSQGAAPTPSHRPQFQPTLAAQIEEYKKHKLFLHQQNLRHQALQNGNLQHQEHSFQAPPAQQFHTQQPIHVQAPNRGQNSRNPYQQKEEAVESSTPSPQTYNVLRQEAHDSKQPQQSVQQQTRTSSDFPRRRPSYAPNEQNEEINQNQRNGATRDHISQTPIQTFTNGEIVKSISQLEAHQISPPRDGGHENIEYTFDSQKKAFAPGTPETNPAVFAQQPQEQPSPNRQNFVTYRPENHRFEQQQNVEYRSTTQRPRPTFTSRTSTSPPVERDEVVTEKNETEEVSEEPTKEELEKKKANLAALPDEVPDDLREQLLSSGILGNADIQILDYDKVGDIPIENLPPEALESLYGAGSAPVPSVVKADGTPAEAKSPTRKDVEMKVVRYNPNTKEGQNVPESYVREDATQLDPVVLNDSRYNRYLPLKVSGTRFPIPDVPQLKDKKVSSVVVLAPVDYDFLKSREESDSAERSSRTVQVQGVRFVAGEALKAVVKEPTTENFEKWLDMERSTSPGQQSVVLLVTRNESNESESDKQEEIFMYDVATTKVSKLKGELSSTFVEVAEANSSSKELEQLPVVPSPSGSTSDIKPDVQL